MAEFALPNRPSTHTTNSYKKTYINSENNKNSSRNESNVDLSWLPNYNDNNNESSNSSYHQNEQNDCDDSWLPNYNNDNKRKTSTPSKSSNSNRPHKTENDYSWLPPTPSVKTQSKNKGQNHTKNNSSTTAFKSYHFRKTETPSHIVNNGDKKKESKTNTSNNHNKSRNNDHWGLSREAVAGSATNLQIQHEKLLNKIPDEASRPQRQVSLSESDGSVETDSLGGVSTLLKRWKDQLDETRNSNTKSKSKHPSSSKSSSICASPSTTDHDSFVDMELCKSSPSRSLSCVIPSQGINDVKVVDLEKEKIQVGNIINKLSNEKVELTARNTNMVENNCVSPVIGKRRLIRGRQAFLDFLNLMEQDKKRELEILTQRKLVSKFPNRGRIQAMLRVRLIRPGVEPKTETKSHKRSVSKTMKTIWDKFSTGVKQGATPSRKVNNLSGEGTKGQISLEYSVGYTSVSEVEVTTNSQKLESASLCNQLAQEAKDHHEIIESTLDKGKDIDSSCQSSQTKKDTCTEIMVPNRLDYHEDSQFHSETMFPSGIDEKGLDDSIQIQSDMRPENCHNWIGEEYSQSQSDWDEEEFHYTHDWISEIARPRSDWECMRQERYQEMLHLYSYNRDLQELLERRSVSIFLSSDQRNKLDQLMVSRTQGILCKQEDVGRELRKEEDGGSRSERQCSEYNNFIDQPTSSSTPTQLTSWSHPNTMYESDQMESPSPFQSPYPFPSPSLWHKPYNNNPQPSSIEMELIYDLRGYVEQLHQEIVELRKSITTMKMQQSAQKKRSEPISTKSNCCVCYTMQADSFLYRCGHMCTCYNCGLELQCTSGKCPICEAFIVDVVRAYSYDE